MSSLDLGGGSQARTICKLTKETLGTKETHVVNDTVPFRGPF